MRLVIGGFKIGNMSEYSKMVMNNIYPNIEFTETTVVGDILTSADVVTDIHLKLSTKIRKLHTDGKWYLMNVVKYAINMKYEDVYKLFIKEVYIYQILGIVNTDIVDSQGVAICKLDTDQQSEEDRIKSLIML